MTDNLDKGISSVAYNHLNLPMQSDISADGNSTTVIKNDYRADGVKIRKENTTTTVGIHDYVTTVHIIEYLDGFQYLENKKSAGDAGSSGLLGDLGTEVAMEREAFSPESRAAAAPPGPAADNAVLQFVPTAEGFYDFTENKYIYQYKDHLGNTRFSYAWNDTTSSIDVLDKNDYYPFGMNHLDPDAGSFFGQGLYKNYKHNGKELQETGFYAMDLRHYMPDIGRFTGMDALSDAYESQSPYHFSLNNPANYSDPTGLYTYDANVENLHNPLKETIEMFERQLEAARKDLLEVVKNNMVKNE